MRNTEAGSFFRARGTPGGAVSTVARLALVLSVASCSWTHGIRFEPDGAAGTEEIASVVTPGTADGLALVVVREVVRVPPSGEVALSEAEIAEVVPWDPGEKVLALPVGLGFIALTPFALAYGIAVTPFGETIGDKDLPAICAPLLTLAAGGACLLQFAWFFQPLPGLATPPADPGALRLERTGGSRTALRSDISAGVHSLPRPALRIRLRDAAGSLLGEGVTDREGRARLDMPAGSVAPGRTVRLDLDLPGATRTLVLAVEPLGAESLKFPPDLPGPPVR